MAILVFFGFSASAKDRVLIGQKDQVDQGEILENLVVVGGAVIIEGEVEVLVAVGSSVLIRPTGRVTRELVRLGSDLVIEQGGEVTAEEHVAMFSGRLQSSQGGQFHWEADESPRGTKSWEWLNRLTGTTFQKIWSSWSAQVLRIVLFLAFTWMAHEFSPHLQGQIQRRLTANPVSCFFMGLFFLFLMGFISVLLIITLIGVFALPFVLLFLLLMTFFGYIHVAQSLGEFIPPLRDFKSPYLAVAVGLILIELVHHIPYLSWVQGVIYLVSLGAAASSFQSRRQVVVVQSS